jgi:kinesin family protein 3/17
MAPAPATTKTECVRVVVRCRPLNAKELADGRASIVRVDSGAGKITLSRPADGVSGGGGDGNGGSGGSSAPSSSSKAFSFDAVFDHTASQSDVYADAAAPVVDGVLAGYNGTILAYGQTGTGKTHTMDGAGAGDGRGIAPRALEHVFAAIAAAGAGRQYLVRASFLEIYNEEICDLLARGGRQQQQQQAGQQQQEKLQIKESKDGSGVHVRGLTAFVVRSATEAQSVLEAGRRNRTVGATLMNQDSSRSHSVFTLTVECSEESGGAADGGSSGGSGGANGGAAPSVIRVGRLNLVDLAGSERQAKTGAAGDRLKEAAKINLSLSALGNVISALADGGGGGGKSGHVPYRDSKLTRLLQDSLGGNARTVMVANVGPADWNYDETLSTLR